MKKTFEVAIVHKEQTNYIIEASSKEEAQQIAEERWTNSDVHDSLGNEWSKIETITANEINK